MKTLHVSTKVIHLEVAMPAPSADRNLLFAVLALQNDLVGRDDLFAGMHAWALDKGRPLGVLLVERGVMRPEHRALLEALLDAQVKKHGSAGQSLRALDASSSARTMLATVNDADVQASLGHVSGDRTTEHRPDPVGGAPRYRVLRPHAKGGLGEVYVAEDLELHREVALKP